LQRRSGARGLCGCIVTALGGVPRFHKAALIPQTMDLLAAEEHERGRHITVALDEAHLLSADQLEELRLLTNSEMDSHPDSPYGRALRGCERKIIRPAPEFCEGLEVRLDALANVPGAGSRSHQSIALRLAGRMGSFAVVIHTRRRSGCTYRTGPRRQPRPTQASQALTDCFRGA
jgi:type II secretory pathway predicted ATPase ExeA